MRVLVADEISSEHLEALKGLGLSVDYRPELGAEDLPQAAQEASIVVVRSTEVTRKVFEAAGALGLVVRAGAGVNTIDVKAASERGVYVANCPGQNAVAVAELTMGLILSADRHIPEAVASLRAGKWDKKRFSRARGLFGRTLGVLGLGSIGSAVAERGKAFGMRVVGCSRSLTQRRAEELGIGRAESALELARRSHFFTVHLPASAETRRLVSKEVLAALPDGAVLVNTSRAEVVDQAALLAEAKAGRIFVSADVFEGEPKSSRAEFSSELASLPNVHGTHHIGASTEQAQEAIAAEAVRIISAFLKEGVVPNCVNVARQTPARCQLIVRHYDRVGVLANVLAELREAKINAQEIENTIFEGAAAACCKIQLDSPPGEDVLGRIRARSDEVIFAQLFELER